MTCDVELIVYGNFTTMPAKGTLRRWSRLKKLLDDGVFDGREQWEVLQMLIEAGADVATADKDQC